MHDKRDKYDIKIFREVCGGKIWVYKILFYNPHEFTKCKRKRAHHFKDCVWVDLDSLGKGL